MIKQSAANLLREIFGKKQWVILLANDYFLIGFDCDWSFECGAWRNWFHVQLGYLHLRFFWKELSF